MFVISWEKSSQIIYNNPFPNDHLPFFAFRVFLHNVEKIPSVQSLVAASKRPNI